MHSATKPRLELRWIGDQWEWWGRVITLAGWDRYIYVGSARYLTVADALAIYAITNKPARSARTEGGHSSSYDRSRTSARL
jgi:hypothetical protein